MRAKIDYSLYNEQALFMELDNTKEQIAELENKKAQIEQALHSIPTEETAFDLKNSHSVGIFNSREEFEKMLESEDNEQ